MKNKASNLIEVRKITALLVVFLFVVLSFMGKLETNFIQTVIISVVAYYFGKSTALDKMKGE
jgi:hypothetical protein